MHRFMKHLDDLAGLDMIVARRGATMTDRRARGGSIVAGLRSMWPAPGPVQGDKQACCPSDGTIAALPTPPRPAHVAARPNADP